MPKNHPLHALSPAEFWRSVPDADEQGKDELLFYHRMNWSIIGLAAWVGGGGVCVCVCVCGGGGGGEHAHIKMFIGREGFA